MSDTTPPSVDRPPEARAVKRRTLRVGITGHRLDKLSGHDLEALRARLANVLGALDAACRHAEISGCRIVSALAEGADRLAIDAAPRHWPLTALLPMPRAIYRHDFLPGGLETSASAEAFDAYLARAETVIELPMLPPSRPDEPPLRDAQYAALGQALVAQIDCLVAIWDGKPPAGPGGTATVVAAAMGRGISVLWIEPSGQLPARLIKRLPSGSDAQPVAVPLDEAVLDLLVTQPDPPS